MTIIEKIEQILNAPPQSRENTAARIADVLLAIYEAIPVTLPANDVYQWAKQPGKPTYMASEVGAEPQGATAAHSKDTNAHADIRKLIENGGVIKAVRSVSVNGVLLQQDADGNINIIIAEVPELKEVGESVTELVDMDIANRLRAIESSNIEVRVASQLVETPNGATDTFTIEKAYQSGTVNIWVNGVKQIPGVSFNELPESNAVQFINYAPKSTTVIELTLTERTKS
jgi:hypothetical protein